MRRGTACTRERVSTKAPTAAISGTPLDPLQHELLILYASLLEQIVGLKRSEGQLRTSLERYRVLYAAVPGGVLVLSLILISEPTRPY